MRVNYDFYSGKDDYSDGEIEKEILEYEKTYPESEYDNIFEKDVRWPIFYHLTPIRKNIINWYPMKKDADVLEIGAGMGAITGTLCEKAKSVTSVELSKQRAMSIANRCKDRDNLEIIVGNFNDIQFEKKFDYITLIGVLEYAPLYTNTKNPFQDFLAQIKTLLKEDGKLLIAIENQFGMKYYAGAVEDHTGIRFDGITGYQNKLSARTFGQKELKQILEKAGFPHTKFYYPLPDYKLPNIIFSDENLPNQNTIEQYTPYYYENTQLEFDEKMAYKEVIKNHQFDFFANSFFIECSSSEITTKIDWSNMNLVSISKNAERFYDKDYTKKKIDYEKRIQELEDRLQQKDQLIETIVNSRSWKMTHIFRKINKKK